jgi:hypothetical protein
MWLLDRQEMTEQFEQHKWIFEPDGSLLDIYVQGTTLDDWLTLYLTE